MTTIAIISIALLSFIAGFAVGVYYFAKLAVKGKIDRVHVTR